jgi:hypothetical protein
LIPFLHALGEFHVKRDDHVGHGELHVVERETIMMRQQCQQEDSRTRCLQSPGK